MADINPTGNKYVDSEQLKQLKKDINYILKRGIKQKHLGELLGMSQPNINHYLHGQVPFTPDIINDFASAFRKMLEMRDKAAAAAKGKAFPQDEATKESEVEEMEENYGLPEFDLKEDMSTIKKTMESLLASQKRIEQALNIPGSNQEG
jgi:transcriptional regulator with XRE-family HTH domain